MEQFFFTYGGAFVAAFFGALFLLGSLLFLYKRFAKKSKSVHHTFSPVSRLGGVALIGSFLFVLWHSPIISFPVSWWVFSGVLVALLVAGLWDDFRNLHWSYQLGLQIGALAVLYGGGVRILTLVLPIGEVLDFTAGWLTGVGLILFLLWGCLILNAVNWLDGVDGLCASVMALTYGTLFVLALSPGVYQPAIAILLATALGATMAFLVYNYPPAKIIGGTSGSLFFGIIIVFVSVVAGTKIATTLLVLALPIIDSLFVLLKRILQRRSLFSPDREHLHHLLQKSGWSDQKIVMVYALLTLLIGIVALSTQSLGKFTASLIVFVILAIFFTFFHFQAALSKQKLFFVGILVVVLMGGIVWGVSQNNTKNALIGGQWYRLEIASTPEAREQGLSGREQLCIHCGMLFVFPEPTEPLFWMKDMQFSLDVLWLLDDRVVAKQENLQYPSLETFGPGTVVTKALELPAGSAKDVPIGAKIYFW